MSCIAMKTIEEAERVDQSLEQEFESMDHCPRPSVYSVEYLSPQNTAWNYRKKFIIISTCLFLFFFFLFLLVVFWIHEQKKTTKPSMCLVAACHCIPIC